MELKGKDLTITISRSAYEKIGHVEGSEKIQSFFQAISNLLTVELDERAKLYLSNGIFLPRIISNMLLNDIPFALSLEQSKEYFPDDITNTEAALAETDPLALIAIISTSVKWSKKAKDLSNDNLSAISLKNISQEMANIFESSGLTCSAKEIASSPEILNRLKNIFDPITKGAIEAIKNMGAEEDEIKEICEALDDSQTESYERIIFQEILSIILMTAIDEDINFTAAISKFNKTTLTASVIENIKRSESFSDNLSELSEDIIGFLI